MMSDFRGGGGPKIPEKVGHRLCTFPYIFKIKITLDDQPLLTSVQHTFWTSVLLILVPLVSFAIQ